MYRQQVLCAGMMSMLCISPYYFDSPVLALCEMFIGVANMLPYLVFLSVIMNVY